MNTNCRQRLRWSLSFMLTLAVTADIAPAQETPRVKAVFVAMTVTSLDSTIAWYQDKLGLEVRRRGAPPGISIESAHLVAPWIELELFMPTNARREATSPPPFGVNKIGVFVAEPTYTAIRTRLRERNATFIGREITEPSGSRFFMVEDHNGLRLQIFMVP